MQESIVVKGYFGDVRMIASEFNQIWLDHVKEMYRLSDSPEWHEVIHKLLKDTRRELDAEFTRKVKQQSEAN